MPVLDLGPTPRPSSNLTPSPQQSAVYDWVRLGSGSATVIAVAGAGKTTTLREASKLMSGSIAFAAYNKKIADQISAKLSADGSSVMAKTFHSFGFSAIKKAMPGAQMDPDKMRNILDKLLGYNEELKGAVGKLVSLAKNHCIGVDKPIDSDSPWEELCDHYDIALFDDDDKDPTEYQAELIELARQALKQSNAVAGSLFDYDDMIYLPLAQNLRVWQNDWLLVDEAQDTNPARRALARRMLKDGGRSIWVGDPHQAIYGFTGADSDALDIIAREFSCIELPLTITYRCPKKVVSFAQSWVSHIQAADTAPEGEVTKRTETEFRAVFKELKPTDVILCRNTRPIVSLAFELIRNNIACHVEGRDIGRGLISLTKRWKVSNARALGDRLQDYKEKETRKLLAKRKEREAEAVADKVETLKVIIGTLPAGASTSQLVEVIRSLFEDTPEGEKQRHLILSTIHKAKGREWPTVYLWGRNAFMPSKFAKQQWELEQEDNLIYVAVTRAQERLVEVTVDA